MTSTRKASVIVGLLVLTQTVAFIIVEQLINGVVKGPDFVTGAAGHVKTPTRSAGPRPVHPALPQVACPGRRHLDPLASDPVLRQRSCCYFVNGHPAESYEASHYQTAATRLWRESADLVGLADIDLTRSTPGPDGRSTVTSQSHEADSGGEPSWPGHLYVHQVRVARPTDRVDEVVALYVDGLGLARLGAFEGPAGYDGVLVGLPGTP